MSISVHGLTVSRGIAIGRAVIVASSRIDVAHYFVKPEQLEAEIVRLREARDAVVAEISKVQLSLSELTTNDVHPELSALLDVHLMLLQDEQLTSGVKHWIVERRICASARPIWSRWLSACCGSCTAWPRRWPLQRLRRVNSLAVDRRLKMRKPCPWC